MELEVRVEDRDIEDARVEITDEIEFESTVGETGVEDACTVAEVETTIDVVDSIVDIVDTTIDVVDTMIDVVEAMIDEVEAAEVGGGSTEESIPEEVAFIDDEVGI